MGTMYEITEGEDAGKRFWLPDSRASDKVRGWIPIDQSVMVPENNNGTHCTVSMSELKRLTPAEIEPRPGTDFCPNCSETISAIRSRNNKIAALKKEVEELKQRIDDLENPIPSMGELLGIPNH